MKTLIYNALTIFAVSFFLFPLQTDAQCLDWVNPDPAGGWTNFNTEFGGAPCDDGSGCPFNEITGFEVWASEAYEVDGFQEGGTYVFSICNGPGAGSWVPEFTIIAPSGAVDAFGAGDGDGCTITWTASESGTYFIVINEAGNCGIENNTDNGYPALTCTSGAPCDPMVTDCNAGVLTNPGYQPVCEEDGTFLLEIENGTDTIPTGGSYGWSFSDQLGGTGAVPNFSITNSTDSVVWDADLNGILSDNLLDPLAGEWVIFGFVYDDPGNPTGSVCSFTADSVIVNFTGGGPSIDDVVDNGDNSATVMVSGGESPYSYEWSDGQTTETASDLPTGTYTVTVTDDNGCIAIGTVDVINTAVGEITGLEDLFLAPNPNEGQFNLTMTLESAQDVRISVLDLTGQSVQNVNLQQVKQVTRSFNMRDLADGIYLLRIQVGQDELTRRIVISR